MTTTVVERIGRLLTNDPATGSGRLGERRDAWVVIDGERVAALGTGSPPAADRRLDAGGRCLLPGFVDSHSHLVFDGDRSAEFAARMAGQPYAAGGIRVSTAATRAASDERLTWLARARLAEAWRGGTTTIEIKSGYGLTVADEERCLRVAAGLSPETTFLGAHVVPTEFEARPDEYVDLVRGPMLAACAPHARWIDVFCETGAFDADAARTILLAGREAGLGLRLHANQLGHGPGVRLAVELGCASADHCTFLDDGDVGALAGSETVATLLPATEFCTRQPYPDARRLLDAGVTVAIAANCNPGSSNTTSIPFCLALAVREMGMTIEEAIWSATAGGARALRRGDIGRVTVGARADLCLLDTPNHTDLVYRPGVPLTAATIVGGRIVAGTFPAERT